MRHILRIVLLLVAFGGFAAPTSANYPDCDAYCRGLCWGYCPSGCWWAQGSGEYPDCECFFNCN